MTSLLDIGISGQSQPAVITSCCCAQTDRHTQTDTSNKDIISAVYYVHLA